MPLDLRYCAERRWIGLPSEWHRPPACPYPDESGDREQWLEGWHDPDQAEPEELGLA